MHPFSIVYFVGVVTFGLLALLTYKQHPVVLFLSGIGITIMGSFLGVDMSNLGQGRNDPMLNALGQSFLLFISVVGGALVSSSIAELRQRFQASNRKVANKNMEPTR